MLVVDICEVIKEVIMKEKRSQAKEVVRFIDLQVKECCEEIHDIADEMNTEMDLDAVRRLAHDMTKVLEQLAIHFIEIEAGNEYEK